MKMFHQIVFYKLKDVLRKWKQWDNFVINLSLFWILFNGIYKMIKNVENCRHIYIILF